MTTTISHTQLANEIHADNIRAGWWSDLNTGVSIIHTRNRPEMLMLIVSELSEASEGNTGDLMDDKLPQYPMFDVELADAAIRIYDLLGCEAGTVDFDAAVNAAYEDDSCTNRYTGEILMQLVNCISDAMEGYRKGNRDKFLGGLYRCLGGIYALSDHRGTEAISEVIFAKRAYNISRLDHKIENRRAVGGKTF